jgi:L-asparaginase/Glu-tRNA(Gln) amidotransferase subunit D
MNLTDKEKKILLVLICTAMGMVALSMYVATQVQKGDEKVINNRIHILHSSGTVEDDFKEKYTANKSKIGKFDVKEYDPMPHSYNISVPDWNQIASDIHASYPHYNVFLVICGKDTMAYTASALAFMLEHLDKPVILCDENVTQALILASRTRIPEVMVASRGKLLRGCRTTAGSTEHLTSPNYPALKPHNTLKMPTEPFNLMPMNPDARVIVIRIYPGDTGQQLASVIGDEAIHGLVLETFGDGKIPISEKLLGIIATLAKQGVVMVAVSQCSKSRRSDIDMRILEAGVLPGYDMTTQAAYAKLAFLLSNVENKRSVGKIMDMDLRGEVTSDPRMNEPDVPEAAGPLVRAAASISR